MNKLIFVNLPVLDLKASTAFYTALGGTLNPQFSGEKSSCMMFSDTIGVMLLTHEHYSQFTQCPIGDARRESQALLALSADSRDAVNETLARASAAGGAGRSQPVAGSWVHVRPQRPGSGRQPVGNHVDGPRGARPKATGGLVGRAFVGWGGLLARSVPSGRKWRRKPLESHKTRKELAPSEALGRQENAARQLSDVVSASAWSSPPMRPFSAS
jgi:uncharacterized protein